MQLTGTSKDQYIWLLSQKCQHMYAYMSGSQAKVASQTTLSGKEFKQVQILTSPRDILGIYIIFKISHHHDFAVLPRFGFEKESIIFDRQKLDR